MSQYQFFTCWEVDGTPEEVYRILEKPEDLPRWWPSVYLDVDILEPGQPGGVGKRVALFTKGWLPYTLRWAFVVTEVSFPTGFKLKASGDFEGTGVWHFQALPGAGRCQGPSCALIITNSGTNPAAAATGSTASSSRTLPRLTSPTSNAT